MAEQRFNVSYSLHGQLVDRVEERARSGGQTRSRQVEGDLKAYYGIVERGMNGVIETVPADELRVIVKTLKASAEIIDPIAPMELERCVFARAKVIVSMEEAKHLSERVGNLRDIERIALCDWVRGNL